MGLWEFVNTPAATENMPHCAMDVAKEIKSRRPRQAELQDFEHIIVDFVCSERAGGAGVEGPTASKLIWTLLGMERENVLNP